MSSARILLVTPFQVTDIGGVSAAVTALAREFTRLGHQVDILVPGSANRVQPHGVIGAVRLHQIYLRVPFLRGKVLRSLVSFCAHFLGTLLELRRFTEARQIDVVMVQYPMPATFYFGILRRLCRWRLVVTYQGNDAHDLHRWSSANRALVRSLLAGADVIVGVSQSLLEKVAAECPRLPREKQRVIPNGAPVESFAADTSASPPGLPARFMLGVGHLIHRKGVDVIIRAFERAQRRGCTLDLVLVGDGEDRAALQQLALDAGVSERVHFLGSRPPEATLQLFKRCDFFVLGSREEGLPLVIVEAMGCGKAVIATRIDGIPEIVQDGATGILVPAEDADAMADAMVRLQSDATFNAELGRNGRERVRNGFSWNAVADRYQDVFEQLGVYVRTPRVRTRVLTSSR